MDQDEVRLKLEDLFINKLDLNKIIKKWAGGGKYDNLFTPVYVVDHLNYIRPPKVKENTEDRMKTMMDELGMIMNNTDRVRLLMWDSLGVSEKREKDMSKSVIDMSLSNYDREKIYRTCLEFLEKCLQYDVPKVTICQVLWEELKVNHPTHYTWAWCDHDKLMKLFPEMLEIKPVVRMVREVWFSLDKDGLKVRIDKIKAAVNTVEFYRSFTPVVKKAPAPIKAKPIAGVPRDRVLSVKNEVDDFCIPLEERERIYRIVLADLKYIKSKNQFFKGCIPPLLFAEVSKELAEKFKLDKRSDLKKLKLMFPEFYGWTFGPQSNMSPWNIIPGHLIDAKIEVFEKVMAVIETKKLYKRKGVYNGY